MGLFDGLLGLKSTDYSNAATAQANGLIAANQAANDGFLTTGYNNAQNDLSSGAANAANQLGANYGNANAALTGYGAQAGGLLTNAINQASGTAQGSNGLYQPAATAGAQSSGMLSNALGLNGAGGTAAAQAAFTGSPGYQYTVDQATQQAQRAAAAGGMLASGNTLAAVSQLGANLANQNYQQYLSNLSGLSNQGLTAASGISGNDRAAAGYQYGGGTTGAGILQQTGQGVGMLDQALGNNQANLQSGLGTSLANEQTGFANAITGNNNAATGAISGNDLRLAQQQDTATNANDQLFSSDLKSLGSGLLGGGGGLLANALNVGSGSGPNVGLFSGSNTSGGGLLSSFVKGVGGGYL